MKFYCLKKYPYLTVPHLHILKHNFLMYTRHLGHHHGHIHWHLHGHYSGYFWHNWSTIRLNIKKNWSQTVSGIVPMVGTLFYFLIKAAVTVVWAFLECKILTYGALLGWKSLFKGPSFSLAQVMISINLFSSSKLTVAKLVWSCVEAGFFMRTVRTVKRVDKTSWRSFSVTVDWRFFMKIKCLLAKLSLSFYRLFGKN